MTIRKFISITILVTFLSTSIQRPAYSQVAAGSMPWMPSPGVRVALSPEFTPAHLKGLVIHPENPLKFDFIIYKGDESLSDQDKQIAYKNLIKYFMASLAVPDENQWVNLSPYEKNRIVEEDFGKTEMGRDLLAQDYLLKQITASLIYPEDELGKKFWDKVYTQAQQQFGSTEIPVNTFNKVWIVPDDATVYESGNTAYVLKNHLKVMLEEDYMAMNKNAVGAPPRGRPQEGQAQGPAPTETNQIGSQIVREIVLPALEKEVNEGKNFVMLRQVYSGMILAAWYKRALKESLLSKIYANKAKVNGINQDPKNNEAIYQQYIKAYKKGVFNYIKEDTDRFTHQPVPRKYFSGGTKNEYGKVMRTTTDSAMATPILTTEAGKLDAVEAVLAEKSEADAAMTKAEEDSEDLIRTLNIKFDSVITSMEGAISGNGKDVLLFQSILARIAAVSNVFRGIDLKRLAIGDAEKRQQILTVIRATRLMLKDRENVRALRRVQGAGNKLVGELAVLNQLLKKLEEKVESLQSDVVKLTPSVVVDQFINEEPTDQITSDELQAAADYLEDGIADRTLTELKYVKALGAIKDAMKTKKDAAMAAKPRLKKMSPLQIFDLAVSKNYKTALQTIYLSSLWAAHHAIGVAIVDSFLLSSRQRKRIAKQITNDKKIMQRIWDEILRRDSAMAAQKSSQAIADAQKKVEELEGQFDGLNRELAIARAEDKFAKMTDLEAALRKTEKSLLRAQEELNLLQGFDAAMDVVTLRNGSQASKEVVDSTMEKLRGVLNQTLGALTLADLEDLARSPDFKIYDGPKATLQKAGLINTDSSIDPDIRNIVLSAIEAKGIDTKLVSPIKEGQGVVTTAKADAAMANRSDLQISPSVRKGQLEAQQRELQAQIDSLQKELELDRTKADSLRPQIAALQIQLERIKVNILALLPEIDNGRDDSDAAMSGELPPQARLEAGINQSNLGAAKLLTASKQKGELEQRQRSIQAQIDSFQRELDAEYAKNTAAAGVNVVANPSIISRLRVQIDVLKRELENVKAEINTAWAEISNATGSGDAAMRGELPQTSLDNLLKQQGKINDRIAQERKLMNAAAVQNNESDRLQHAMEIETLQRELDSLDTAIHQAQAEIGRPDQDDHQARFVDEAMIAITKIKIPLWREAFDQLVNAPDFNGLQEQKMAFTGKKTGVLQATSGEVDVFYNYQNANYWMIGFNKIHTSVSWSSGKLKISRDGKADLEISQNNDPMVAFERYLSEGVENTTIVLSDDAFQRITAAELLTQEGALSIVAEKLNIEVISKTDYRRKLQNKESELSAQRVKVNVDYVSALGRGYGAQQGGAYSPTVLGNQLQKLDQEIKAIKDQINALYDSAMTTKSEGVRQKVHEAIKKVVPSLDHIEFKDTDDLQKDFSVDSQDVIVLMIELEDSFNIRIPNDKTASLRTVGDIVQYVTDKISDSAMATKGGIDFNAANLNLQIKRDGAGVPLPISQQNLENIHIDGLVPVIMEIRPAITLPMFSQLQKNTQLAKG